MELKISTIKGMPGLARITGIDTEVLTKACALNHQALIAKEDGKAVFIITTTNDQSLISSSSLEVNVNDVENGLLGVCVVGDPETTLVAAVNHIVNLYEKAKELAEKYDATRALIKEV